MSLKSILFTISFFGVAQGAVIAFKTEHSGLEA